MRKQCYVIEEQEIASCKNILLRCQLLYYSFCLRYFHKLYIHLKRISCRIEWFVFQLHSLKHVRVIIIFLMIRKAIILAFRSQGVKNHTVMNCSDWIDELVVVSLLSESTGVVPEYFSHNV